MIEADGLWKVFGAFAAVRGVSFGVPKGQIVGFLGPNGAGKTTTIRILTGFFAPSAGSARVDGFDCVEQSHQVRRRIGYLPESAPLYREMRAEEFLDYRGRLFGMARRPRRQAIDRVVEQCWLREVRRKRIGQLSKGYRQRVGLASALLHDPPVLILDEPTSGLDPTQIMETGRLLRELAGERTLLLSSHILPQVEQTCDRILVIARGRVVVDGTPSELRASAADGATIVVEAHPGEGATIESLVAAARAAGAPPAGGGGSGGGSGGEGVGMVVAESLPDGWVRLRIEPGQGAGDLRAAVSAQLHRAGASLRELRTDNATLEAVFAGAIARAESEVVA